VTGQGGDEVGQAGGGGHFCVVAGVHARARRQ
jgi:hypothetical protein